MNTNGTHELQPLVEALWGGSVEMRWRSPAPGRVNYGLAPRAARPRLLFPVSEPAIAADALQAYRTSRRSTRAVMKVAAALARVGLQDRLFSRFVTVGRGEGNDLERALAQVLSRPEVMFSVSVDLDRPHHKPTLRIVAPDGQLLAFAKVGWNMLTRPLVRKEAAVLTSLRDTWSPRNLQIPLPLGVLHHAGLEILVLTPLGDKGRPGPSPRQLPIAATRELTTAALAESISIGGSAYWRKVRRRIAAQEGHPLLSVVADLIERRWGEHVMGFGIGHGDWVPWNMGMGSRLCVWDWERGALDAPLGFDAVYFALQVALHWDRKPPEQAVRSASNRTRDLLPSLGLPARMAEPLLHLVLLEMLTRFAEASATGIHADSRKYRRAWETLMTAPGIGDEFSGP